MEARTYYYARVSTKGQNLDRQIEEFRRMGADERFIIVDKNSGRNFDRPGYLTLKESLLREGDTLVVKELDRFGRNKQQIKDELEFFQKNGIRVKILDIPTTLIDVEESNAWLSDLMTNLLIEVLASLAEQELQKNKKRQAEGIAEAKEKGKHLGRSRILLPDNWNEVYSKWMNNEITAMEAMKQTGLKRSTFYKMARNERGKENQ